MAKSKSTGFPKPVLLGIVIAVVIVGFILYNFIGNSPTNSKNSYDASMQTPSGEYNFEILDLGNGASHVVVASKTQDVRKLLPIMLEFFKNGKSVWKGTIQGDSAVVCRGATGCSIDGPNYNDLDLQPQDTLEIVATTQDGTVLARESAIQK